MNRILIAFYILLCTAPGLLLCGDNTSQPAEAKARYESVAKETPVVFIPNRGQIVDSDGHLRPDLLFSTSGNGVKIYFRRTGISYVFARVEEQPTSEQAQISEATGKPMHHSSKGKAPKDDIPTQEPLVSVYRMDMELQGCNTNAEVLGEEETEQYFNYYLAHCPDGITNVHGYRRIVYKNIYDNIDLVFHSSRYGIKYDFVVRPGGDPKNIKMDYKNAGDIGLKANRLHLSTPLGAIEEEAPVTYAINNGTYKPLAMNGRPVRSHFVLQDNTVGFAVEDYDRSQTLVIDPYVLWSTYLGGEAKEHVEGVTIEGYLENDFSNPIQRVIVTGWTLSAGFPTAAWNGKKIGIYKGQTDAFLAAISSEGEMLWYTFFGGDKFDRADAIACANPFRYGTSNTYGSSLYAITGQTRSETGITSAQTGYTIHQNTFAGKTDAFVATFDGLGQKLWSTYLGGDAEDYGYDIAIRVENTVAMIGITGQTNSSAFPVVPSGSPGDWLFQGKQDAFAAVLSDKGQVEWSRCFGGGYEDAALAIDVDPNGNWLIGGWTISTDLPGPVAINRQFPSGVDIMLAKFDDSGSILKTAYFGDAYDDYCTAVAFNSDGDIIVGGYAYTDVAGDYTFFAKPYQQSTYGGGSYDGILVKFDGQFDDEQAWWATLYGGDNDDRIEDIAVDYYGDIWIVGRTNSSPSANIADGQLMGYEWDQSIDDWKVLQDGRLSQPIGWEKYWPIYDTFIAKFDSEGRRTWSSYYGKEGSNIGTSIASGYFYGIAVAGWTADPHSDKEIPLFHTNTLQSVANTCDEGYVMLMREFGFPMHGFHTVGYRSCVVIDSKNRIVTAGDDEAVGFPTTVGAHQSSLQATKNGVIAKMDSTGAPIWATYFGGSQDIGNVNLAINQQDNILVGALQEYSNANGSVTDREKGDGYLALFTKDGLIVNSAVIDGAIGTRVNIADLCFEPDGSILVFGATDADIELGRTGERDGFITRYSSDLSNRQWWKYWGGAGDDFLFAGTVTSTGEIIVAGLSGVNSNTASGSNPFPRWGSFASTPYGGGDEGFVSKFDCSGQCIWSRCIGGSGADHIDDLGITTDGTIVVAGTTTSTNLPVTVGAFGGYRDAFITKFHPDGQISWGTYVGGSGDDDVASFVIDQEESIVLLTRTKSNDYPLLNAAQPARRSIDDPLVYITKFNSINQMERSACLAEYVSYPYTHEYLSYPISSSVIAVDIWNRYIFFMRFNLTTNNTVSREAAYYYHYNGILSGGTLEVLYKSSENLELWSAP